MTRHSVRFGFVGLLSALALTTIGPHAAAQTSNTGAQTAAQGLFEEGRRLMTEGKLDEACPKLAESQRLDPGGGTVLNLALCHEQQGRIASAWAEFNEALGWAIKDGRENREKLAREHIDKLAPKLSRMTVTPTAEARVPGLQIKIDGVALGEPVWGLSTPTDAGDHVIEASAPHYRVWSETVTMKGNAATLEVEIPALVPLPPEEDVLIPKPGEEPEQKMSPARRNAIYISYGTAIAGIGAGAVFTVLTLAKRSDSNSQCQNGDTACSPEGVRLNNTAITYSWVSTATFGVGIAAAAVGTYLLITGQPPKKKPADQTPATPPQQTASTGFTLAPFGGLQGGGITLGKRW